MNVGSALDGTSRCVEKGVPIHRNRFPGLPLPQVAQQAGQRTVIVVQHGLPVNVGEVVEHVGPPGAVSRLHRGVGYKRPEVKLRLDHEMPNVHIAEEHVVGVERRRIEEAVGLLPGNRRIGQITRRIGGRTVWVGGNADLIAIQPIERGTVSLHSVTAGNTVCALTDYSAAYVQIRIPLLVRRAIVDAKQSLVHAEKFEVNADALVSGQAIGRGQHIACQPLGIKRSAIGGIRIVG